jgi:hypothetical protein
MLIVIIWYAHARAERETSSSNLSRPATYPRKWNIYRTEKFIN